MCVLVSSYDILLKSFLLISSIIVENSRSYPMGILQRELTLKSVRCLCAIIAVII